jgi:hypothetical protein
MDRFARRDLSARFAGRRATRQADSGRNHLVTYALYTILAMTVLAV